MSKATRSTSFYNRMKTTFAGFGSSIIEARRLQAEYRRRYGGSID